MKYRWIAGAALLLLLGVFYACGLFTGDGENVSSLSFSRDEVMLEVVPDYEMRTLSVVYGAYNPGVIGGDFFERFEEIVDIFSDYSLQEDADAVEGADVFFISFNDGEVVDYFFDAGDDSDEFLLLDSFYSDVAELFTEEVY